MYAGIKVLSILPKAMLVKYDSNEMFPKKVMLFSIQHIFRVLSNKQSMTYKTSGIIIQAVP